VVLTLVVMADSVRVDVRDAGPGIAPEYQARIFEPYERGVGSEAPAGLGLGCTSRASWPRRMVAA
jgi:signal transduction histidine kinase